MDLAWLFLSFEGRISRGQHGLGMMVVGFLGSALQAMHVFLHVDVRAIGFVLLLPTASLVAKRLHDLGCSMAIAIGPGLLTAAFLALTWDRGGMLTFTEKAPPTAHDIPAIGLYLLLVAFWSWLGFAPGKRRANPYGEPPR